MNAVLSPGFFGVAEGGLALRQGGGRNVRITNYLFSLYVQQSPWQRVETRSEKEKTKTKNNEKERGGVKEEEIKTMK